MAIGIGAAIGVVIILWGGYSLFSSKVKTAPNTVTAATGNESDSQRTSQYLHNLDDPQKALQDVINKDSASLNQAAGVDSPKANRVTPAAAATTASPVIPTGPSKMYKFILQTTKYRTTAENMYNKLKPRVQMEAVDSSLFKIVISVPGTPADTTRIKDSLRFWYWGARNDKQVMIEQ
jgi:hypothetical protein